MRRVGSAQVGWRKLVCAIALTDHSVVARFEEERAVGPNRAQRVLGIMISNWRAVGPALLPAFTCATEKRFVSALFVKSKDRMC